MSLEFKRLFEKVFLLSEIYTTLICSSEDSEGILKFDSIGEILE